MFQAFTHRPPTTSDGQIARATAVGCGAQLITVVALATTLAVLFAVVGLVTPDDLRVLSSLIADFRRPAVFFAVSLLLDLIGGLVAGRALPGAEYLAGLAVPFARLAFGLLTAAALAPLVRAAPIDSVSFVLGCLSFPYSLAGAHLAVRIRLSRSRLAARP